MLLRIMNTEHFLYLASQMWTLPQLLPLMIGRHIPEEDEHWCHYLQLLDIVEYTMSPMVHSYTAVYLASLIKDNLETYKELYLEVSFIPKMHYLVHVPQYLERYTCMHVPLVIIVCMQTWTTCKVLDDEI